MIILTYLLFLIYLQIRMIIKIMHYSIFLYNNNIIHQLMFQIYQEYIFLLLLVFIMLNLTYNQM